MQGKRKVKTKDELRLRNKYVTAKNYHDRGIVGGILIEKLKDVNSEGYDELIKKKLELETQMMFNTIQGYYIARELKDYSTHEQQLYLTKYLDRAKKIVAEFEKHYGFNGLEESDVEEGYFYCLDIIHYTQKQLMSAMEKGTTEQFKLSIKHF